MDTVLQFSANLEGSKSLFSLHDFIIKTGTSKPLAGDFTFERNPDNFPLSSLNLKLKQGLLNKENLSQILIRKGTNYTKFILPSNLDMLSRMDVNLILNGTLKELDSRVSILSNLGQINGDIFVDATNKLYQGELTINDLSGYVLNVDEGINDFDGELKFKGKGFDYQQVDLQVEGFVNTNYNGYEYDNIEINGVFLNESFDGFLALEDQHVNATFKGLFDLNQKPTKYNFSMDVKSLNHML